MFQRKRQRTQEAGEEADDSSGFRGGFYTGVGQKPPGNNAKARYNYQQGLRAIQESKQVRETTTGERWDNLFETRGTPALDDHVVALPPEQLLPAVCCR
jgi:hypothetical protein